MRKANHRWHLRSFVEFIQRFQQQILAAVAATAATAALHHNNINLVIRSLDDDDFFLLVRVGLVLVRRVVSIFTSGIARRWSILHAPVQILLFSSHFVGFIQIYNKIFRTPTDAKTQLDLPFLLPEGQRERQHTNKFIANK